MGRLICISNRVMTPDQLDTSGGSLLPCVSFSVSVMAFGPAGPVRSPTAAMSMCAGCFTSATIDMSREEHEGAYLGYSNSVLWPVFHNRLDLARFDRNFYGAYAAYNKRMADMVAGFVQPGDVIWVHDYHFMILGQLLRERGITQPIGFFLHIPMPPPEAFLALPEFSDLATSLAAYDLSGFKQLTMSATHLRACVPPRALSFSRAGGSRLQATAFKPAVFPSASMPRIFSPQQRELLPCPGRQASSGFLELIGSTIPRDCRRNFAGLRICSEILSALSQADCSNADRGADS